MTRPALAVAAVVAVTQFPFAAAADTTCDRGAFRHDWMLSASLNTDVNSAICSLSFTSAWGHFQGDCHFYSDQGPGVPPSERWMTASGQMILDSSCHFTGSMTLAGGPASVIATLEGYASGAVVGLPQIATGFGSVDDLGNTAHVAFTMSRRMWNSGVDPIVPPA